MQKHYRSFNWWEKYLEKWFIKERIRNQKPYAQNFWIREQYSGKFKKIWPKSGRNTGSTQLVITLGNSNSILGLDGSKRIER